MVFPLGEVAVAAVIAMGACCVRADDGWEAKREALKNRPRPLVLNSDGNEVIYWKTNLPVTIGNFTAQRLETYRGSRVSTVSYCPQSSGFGLMTTTRAGEFFDIPRCIPELRPDCLNVAPLLKAKGLDCLDLTADYCHTNGMEVFVSIRVNDTHDCSYFIPGTKPPRSYLFPKWKDANPDCLFGSRTNRPPFCAWTAVDFENPKTRDHMKKFVGDFVNNYDVDGIEYDFFRHGQVFKSVGWGAYATEAQLKLMTDFMLELRAITEAAGRKKGKPILVLVRTSDSLGYAKAQGLDVEAWLRRGVMDIWSVSDYFQLDYLKPNADLAHKYGVKFNSALAESRVPGAFKREKKNNKRLARAIMLPGRNTIESYAAEYSAAMAAGCDGISSFNLSCTGGINKRGLLDVDPRRTKDLDKVYFALVRGSGGYRPESWVKDGGKFYVRPRIDPATVFKIPAGKPYAFGIEFGDEDWKRFDTVAKAAFAGGQRVITEFRVNGKVIAPGAFTDGVQAFPLQPGDLRKGYNEFSVTVDPKFGKELTFHDFAVYLTRPVRPKPNAATMKRLAEDDTVIGIVHFSVNTFTDREWGYGSEDPKVFDPTDFDAEQIVKACADGGIKGLVVVAKHHDGFCLWPTKTTGHNITKSPFRGGKGDYVKEMSEACRKFGVKFGVYCSPWDRNNADYARPKYVETYHEQIRELTGGAYGPIFELWLDGANGGDGYYGGAWEKRSIKDGYYRFGDVVKFVRGRNPDLTIFGFGGEFCWPGNESGLVDPDSGCTRDKGFRPYEADFPLRPGWFYHQSQDGFSRSGEFLMKVWLRTVGNAATMDIGISPDRRGRLTDEDVGALRRFAELKRIFFSNEVTSADRPFNLVMLEEDVRAGERVDAWRLALDGREIAAGKRIGFRRIRTCDRPVAGKDLRLEIRSGEAKADDVKVRRYFVDPDLLAKVLSSSEPKQPPAPFELRGVLTVKRPDSLTFMVKHARTARSLLLTPDKDRLGGTPVVFRLAHSHDGEKWTEEETEYRLDNVAANPIAQRVDLPRKAPVKYVRLTAVRTLDEGAPVSLGGLELMP